MVIGVDAHPDPFDPKLLDETPPIHIHARWTSPELMEGSRPTKESDIYALGMVIYEVRICVTMTVD